MSTDTFTQSLDVNRTNFVNILWTSKEITTTSLGIMIWAILIL